MTLEMENSNCMEASESTGMIIYCVPSSTNHVLKIDSAALVGQKLFSDNADGPDHLGVQIVAWQLAKKYLASASLEPPFVLGIIGKWGTDKSYLFNLIKQQLIQLQKVPVRVRARDNSHAGHIYCIKVDAWTYGKETCGGQA